MLRRRGPQLHLYTRKVYAALRARLRELEEDSFHFIDAVDVFSHLTARDEVFIDLYHFGDRGNEIVARRLLAELSELPVWSRGKASLAPAPAGARAR